MKQYQPRDKITQKMTRDGLIEVNETKETAERVSRREQDADLQSSHSRNPCRTGRSFKVCRRPPRFPTSRGLSRSLILRRRARHGARRRSTDPESQ